jgi:hypothetical protein
MENKPCPICKSNNLKFAYHISYGQGDCTYEAWIECNKCGIHGAYSTGWGSLPIEQEQITWDNWNKLL